MPKKEKKGKIFGTRNKNKGSGGQPHPPSRGEKGLRPPPTSNIVSNS